MLCAAGADQGRAPLRIPYPLSTDEGARDAGAGAATSAQNYAALLAATAKDTKPFRLEGFFLGRVVSVYDADTLRLAVVVPKLGLGEEGAPEVRYLRIRTLGYDAPEMKGPSHDYGKEVRSVLTRLVEGRILLAYIPAPGEDGGHGLIVPKKEDPYGRVLAHLFALPLEPGAEPPSVSEPGDAELPTAQLAALSLDTGPARPERPASGMVKGGGAVLVRGRPVEVPRIGDVPADARPDFATLAGLLHVNAWMIANARVKRYDGHGAREGYTADEVANGVA
jgi:endonuclease YncB( thermonuclease family)